MKKLNLTQQQHTFTNQRKCTTTQNKHEIKARFKKKLKVSLKVSFKKKLKNHLQQQRTSSNAAVVFL